MRFERKDYDANAVWEAVRQVRGLPPGQASAFTGQDVGRLLRQARAPEPWLRPDRCQNMAFILNAFTFFRSLRSEAEKFDRRKTEIFQAVQTLRRELPDMISAFWPVTQPQVDLFSGKRDEIRELERQSLRKLQAAIDEAFPPNRKFVGTVYVAKWQPAADALARLYEHVVGRSAATRNGPTVRFIVASLEEMGHGQLTPDAVEQHLRRRRARAS